MNKIINYLYDNLKDDPLYWDEYNKKHGATHPLRDQASDYWYELFKGEDSHDAHHMPVYSPTVTHHTDREMAGHHTSWGHGYEDPAPKHNPHVAFHGDDEDYYSHHGDEYFGHHG